MAIKKKLSPQTPCFCNNSRYSYYVNPAANVMQFNKHIFLLYIKTSNLWRAVVVQPMQSNSVTRPVAQKKKKKVKKLRYTVHVYLNWKCRTVKVPYKVLWFFFFLANMYIKKVHSIIPSNTHAHQRKKITTVLRQCQFHLLFEQELKKSNRDLGSDWHTGCYNQPTLSVTDGK